MTQRERIYLDNAATSWPKPEAVYVAMDRYAREFGAAAGRGEYRAAIKASEIVASCRRQLMNLINAGQASEIAFFSNGTTALNAAIFGTIRQGDHVVTTAIEHNSVLRPLEELRTRGVIQLDIIECDLAGNVDIQQMLDSINDQTALVALAHGSNVTGAVQNIGPISERLRDTQTLLLCDTAQTLGYLPVDVCSLGIDLLAAPGHKGTNGPLGTGMLYVSPKASTRLRPTIFGGTGSISDSLHMPTQLPDMLEAGNLNVPAIAGWNAGLEYLRNFGSLSPQYRGEGNQDAAKHRIELCQRMSNAFSNLTGGFAIVGSELPIASLVFDELAPALVGSLLDSEFSIDVRCGLHCAALVHEPIRATKISRHPANREYHGTLRISAGHFTTHAQIDAVATAIDDLVAELTNER